MSKLSNIDYWQRRYLQIKAKEIRNTEAYERALQPELNGLFRDLNKEMEGWYVRYANNNGISKEDAAKILAGIHTKHWQLTLKEFEKKAKAGGHTQELNNEYYRSRVARLQALEQQMKQHTARFAGNEANHMRDALAEQYDDTYMRTTFNTQVQKAKLTADFARFNEAQLKIAVSQPWGKDGKDFSKRIWKNYQEELPSYLMDSVMRGTFLGWSPQRISTQMHARFQDVKRNNIHRLVVSEMGHVASEATAKSYEENEIEQYEYMATLESHTCAVCAKLDGQIFKLSDRKPGINYPLIHAQCRCDTVPYIKGLPDVQQRWMRDSETGKGKLIKNMKFDEWKQYVNGDKPMPKVTTVKPKAKKNFISDDIKATLGASAATRLNGKINDSPKIMQQVWMKYADQMAFEQYDNKSQSVFNPNTKKVRMNKKNFEGKAPGHKPDDVFFHEFGHMIDWTASGRRLPLSATPIYGLADVMEADYRKYKADDRIHPDVKGADSYKEWGDVSDMIAGATGGKKSLGFGHGGRYWRVDGMQETEAFAEMTSATINNPESLEHIKQIFPNGYKLYLQMLQDIIDNGPTIGG